LEDLSSDEESLDGDSNNGAGEPTELDEKRYRRLHVLRSKVDALSTLFLKHLERIFAGKTKGSQNLSSLSSVAPPSLPFHRSYTNPDNRLAHFQTLLSIFDRLVLPTFQCRRAQFIVFWCCSLDSGYTDLFLGLLVSRALYETTQPAVNRVAAASYIASFVSRAKYIDDDQVRTVVQYLTAYIDGILAEARSDPMAVAASGGLMVFYTVCQAVMMIFCFRWRALQSAAAGEETMADEMEMDDVEGSESADQSGWMADMDVLQKAVFSQLNPLMVSFCLCGYSFHMTFRAKAPSILQACYPIVVDMFAKIAHTTKFMFCYSVITANRSALESTHVAHSISLENLGSSDVTQVLPLIGRQSLSETSLDSFFPFDPYDLPRARTFVETFYRNWDEVAVQTEDEDDEDEFGTSTETETEDDEGGDFPRSQSFSHSSNYIGIVGRAMRTGGNDAHANELSTSLEGISLSQRQLPLGLVA
jgi:RNA polymerase I-specific transcription initiation factor RRN3